MADDLPSKGELLAMIREYHKYIESSTATEAKSNEMIGELDNLVPHANISDLMFWGEIERSDEEVAEESLLRETIWRQGGDLRLLIHIQSQLQRGLNDPTAPEVHKNYAIQTLAEVAAEIRRLEEGTRH